MNTWMADIRFALRSFAKNPWFTLVAVLSLAIGIGADYLHLQCGKCAVVPASTIRQPRPISDPVEHLAWLGYYARLVFYRAILRH